MRTTAFIASVLASLIWPAIILAQADLQRFERQAEILRRDQDARALSDVPVDQRALVDYGGYASFDYYSIDDPSLNNRVLRQYQIVGFVRVNLDNAQELYLRARIGYQDFNDGDSFDGRGDQPIDGDLDRGFYRFDLNSWQIAHGQRPSDLNITAEGGRDLVYWGNGLVLSEVLDGAGVRFTQNDNQLDLIAGVTPIRTVDLDPDRPDFNSNTRRGFYGAMLSRQVGQSHPYVYGLLQRDYNQDDESFTGGVTTDYDYNSYYIGIGSTGAITDKLLYGVECSYEGGNTLSNSFVQSGPNLVQIPQTRDNIQALAGDARLDYLLLDSHKSRLSVEIIAASGDSDRLSSTTSTFGGNKSGTDDRAFNAFGLINTGLEFAPAVSNLLALRVGAVTFPLPDHHAFDRCQFGTDLFFYCKMNPDAPIDEPTTDERYLGCEPDFFLNWQITSDITFALRYGIFFPGTAIISDDKPRQFIGAGVTYAF